MRRCATQQYPPTPQTDLSGNPRCPMQLHLIRPLVANGVGRSSSRRTGVKDDCTGKDYGRGQDCRSRASEPSASHRDTLWERLCRAE